MASRDSTSVRSPAVQDYAKAIYALERRDGEAVSTNALADRLGVTAASASGMVKRLGEFGLVEHEPYRGVSLTEDGRRVALEVRQDGGETPVDLGAHHVAPAWSCAVLITGLNLFLIYQQFFGG